MVFWRHRRLIADSVHPRLKRTRLLCFSPMNLAYTRDDIYSQIDSGWFEATANEDKSNEDVQLYLERLVVMWNYVYCGCWVHSSCCIEALSPRPTLQLDQWHQQREPTGFLLLTDAKNLTTRQISTFRRSKTRTLSFALCCWKNTPWATTETILRGWLESTVAVILIAMYILHVRLENRLLLEVADLTKPLQTTHWVQLSIGIIAMNTYSMISYLWSNCLGIKHALQLPPPGRSRKKLQNDVRTEDICMVMIEPSPRQLKLLAAQTEDHSRVQSA